MTHGFYTTKNLEGKFPSIGILPVRFLKTVNRGAELEQCGTKLIFNIIIFCSLLEKL